MVYLLQKPELRQKGYTGFRAPNREHRTYQSLNKSINPKRTQFSIYCFAHCFALTFFLLGILFSPSHFTLTEGLPSFHSPPQVHFNISSLLFPSLFLLVICLSLMKLICMLWPECLCSSKTHVLKS